MRSSLSGPTSGSSGTTIPARELVHKTAFFLSQLMFLGQVDVAMCSSASWKGFSIFIFDESGSWKAQREQKDRAEERVS